MPERREILLKDALVDHQVVEKLGYSNAMAAHNSGTIHVQILKAKFQRVPLTNLIIGSAHGALYPHIKHPKITRE